MKEHHVSIWFLIGLQLSIYGVLIVGSGIYVFFNPPEQTTILENLHPAIWWGAIMLVLGLFYTLKYRPRNENSLQK
jgi:FtsH-binding integral membrane protein